MANHGLEQTAHRLRQDTRHLERETCLRVPLTRAAAQAECWTDDRGTRGSMRTSWTFRCALGIGMLAAVGLGPLPVQAQATPGWAKSALEVWFAAFHGGDAGALSRLYLSDAVLLEPEETFRGREAIRAHYGKAFREARSECTWVIEGVDTVGRQAAVWGQQTCLESPKPRGSTRTVRGRWLTIFEHQADGSWLIARDAGEAIQP